MLWSTPQQGQHLRLHEALAADHALQNDDFDYNINPSPFVWRNVLFCALPSVGFF